MKNLLIVVPAYREHKNILKLCYKILNLKSQNYKFNILVIDDQEDILKNIKAILEDELYKVDIALNSKESLNLINTKNYDLIILDVWLDNSELDGFRSSLRLFANWRFLELSLYFFLL